MICPLCDTKIYLYKDILEGGKCQIICTGIKDSKPCNWKSDIVNEYDFEHIKTIGEVKENWGGG